MIKHMAIIKCDRCGHEEHVDPEVVSVSEWRDANMVILRDYGEHNDIGDDWTEHELCLSCYKMFKTFLNPDSQVMLVK